MNSYDRFMGALNGRRSEIDRIPCVNSASVCTIEFMRACDAYWPAAHKDHAKMASLGSAAHRLCGLDNITVPFSTTVEAEVLGAPINYHDGKIKWPYITGFQVKDPSDFRFPDEVSSAGTLPAITKAIRLLKRDFGGTVPINAYLVPPFTSISSYLVDSTEFLKCIIREPKMIHDFCQKTLELYIEIARIYKEAGADVITLHEMGASNDNISPRHFDEFVKPYLKKIIESLGPPTILNICGSTLKIIDKMVECGPSAIAVDEKTPMVQARKIVDSVKPGMPLIGNISPHGVIHLGPVEKIRESVRDDIKNGTDMVAPGCDFWLETPTNHIRAFVEATRDFGTR